MNRLLSLFIFAHILFAVFLGRLYALAPDEVGYLYTFNKIYTLPINISAQTGSGWIAAPTVFLWVAYLPAKFLNIIGVEDYLSIRILSTILAALSLYLLLGVQKFGQPIKRNPHLLVIMVFFIPSIFLWNSVGLRESFIIAEIAVFLTGYKFLSKGSNITGMIFLFLGSYGLVSTKSYLWVCLMIALLLSSIIFLVRGIERAQAIKFMLAGFLLPLAIFAGTTSAYALAYIFQSDISATITATGARAGDSITQVYVDGTGTDMGTGTDNGSSGELITFHGDYTLIALHFYLVDNPNSRFSQALRVMKLDKRIQNIWNEKVAMGLIHKDKQVGTDTSSLNGRIIEPAKLNQPLSLVRAAFMFLCGPFPFIGDPGIAVTISSFESPLWWIFYGLVIFQFIRFRNVRFTRDPQIVFTLIFLFGEVLFSALVEVNLGTSFRHRSILLVPLVFLYVRITQAAKESNDTKLKNEILA